MIRYSDLVNYTKENHIRWNQDLFDVLKGFFEYYLPQPTTTSPYQQDKVISYDVHQGKFDEPADGEYTLEDVINLFDS